MEKVTKTCTSCKFFSLSHLTGCKIFCVHRLGCALLLVHPPKCEAEATAARNIPKRALCKTFRGGFRKGPLFVSLTPLWLIRSHGRYFPESMFFFFNSIFGFLCQTALCSLWHLKGRSRQIRVYFLHFAIRKRSEMKKNIRWDEAQLHHMLTVPHRIGSSEGGYKGFTWMNNNSEMGTAYTHALWQRYGG